MANIPTLMSGEALNAALAKLPKALQAHNEKLQSLALQCIMHAKEHGDTGYAGKMIAAFRDRGDGKAHPYLTGLTRWLRTYTPIRPKQGAKGVYRLMKADEEGFIPFNVEGAAETPFYMLNGGGNDALAGFADVVKLGLSPAARFKKMRDENKLAEMNPATIARLERAFGASHKAFQTALGLLDDSKAAIEAAEARTKARDEAPKVEAPKRTRTAPQAA